MPAEPVAAARTDAHTRSMGVFLNRRFVTAAIGAISLATAAAPVSADEIRLKDGKKLYGVFVSYEDNVFKVKTDFGYVLVEKDKIASIIPDTPPEEAATSATAKPAAKSESATKASAIVNNSAARPEIPLTAAKGDVTPPPIKT